MSLFSFLKDAGEKILDALTPDKAEANSEALTKHVQDALTGIDTSKIQVKVEGEKVIATGEAASQEEKEKILLALGNVAGISGVDDQITVTGPVDTPASADCSSSRLPAIPSRRRSPAGGCAMNSSRSAARLRTSRWFPHASRTTTLSKRSTRIA